MHQGPNGAGLSRKAIMSEIDKSLKRLGTDYVDLYQIHRWDYNTPIEETMEALHDVVKAGKARYIGASAMYAWQFLKALHVAEKKMDGPGLYRCRIITTSYTVKRRGRCCRFVGRKKIGVIPYSPLASGRLTRDWSETTYRSETDQVQKSKYDATANTDRLIVERVAAIAEKTWRSPSSNRTCLVAAERTSNSSHYRCYENVQSRGCGSCSFDYVNTRRNCVARRAICSPSGNWCSLI